ncbi:MAG: beta-L-arabinofuranosidase domain-containing protein, partial [Acidobacteriota bacterium]
MKRIHLPTVLCCLMIGLTACGSGSDNKGGRLMGEQNEGEQDRTGLRPLALTPLSLGEIRPGGWLRNQLRLQLDSLSGSLDRFWPDIMNSAWFGGEGDGWERGPYWLDGVVPLAFLLDDEPLLSRIRSYVDTILTEQDENGRFAPVGVDARYDLWAVFLVLKPLIQYHDATGDPRIPASVEKALRWVDDRIDRYPLFNWGQFRWFESLPAVYWLYERSPDRWLLDLAVKLQAQGFDWQDFYTRFPLTDPTSKGKWTYMGHVVNNAMAVKAPALWWRLSGEERDRTMASEMIRTLDRYHGQVTGMFTGDECFAGKNPSQGTELCAVVEYMYSLEVLVSVLGDPAFADRLEKVAFNALPATFSPDMWAHQYDQQVNQVLCSIDPDRNWTTNGPESNLYGLEPNYGCCTANFSQGWPKLAANLWMKTADGGLAAVVYAPCTVRTEIDGIPVEIDVETDYPFRETVKIHVRADRAVRFPIHLRIPGWADGTVVRMEGEKEISAQKGTYSRIEREWNGQETLTLLLPMTPRASRRFQNALSIERGPLVYALKIGEEWKRVNADKPHRELPHGDWEVYPTSPWNFALDLSEDDVAGLFFMEFPLGEMPFSPENAPVSVAVKGILLKDWRLVNGSAGELPLSPVQAAGETVNLVLIPYGCT